MGIFLKAKALMACPECGYGNSLHIYWFGIARYQCDACGLVSWGRVVKKPDGENK